MTWQDDEAEFVASGADVACGSCACIFFCGHTVYEHTCETWRDRDDDVVMVHVEAKP